ncbi:ABC transporter ATP-binding protein [Stieleria sp. JC731]|uniref:ABC transporter ATP-binding protein n=1 Tax=Pirellulaceae TaxID=2691357 RepID=UPI001E4A3FF5|nr:ABC transporter ATP-binding protein [Stieleria sp. JC731]MCC9602987.1 ABC transporter ATP-binding protein [Stieleria sp. JC731]
MNDRFPNFRVFLLSLAKTWTVAANPSAFIAVKWTRSCSQAERLKGHLFFSVVANRSTVSHHDHARTVRLAPEIATLENIIEIDHVTKRYGDIEALQDISLQFPPGVTGLLGPNGSGKSTLIKALLGLLSTQAGNGRILDYKWPRDAQQIRDSIGYLPEDDCYIAGLDGIESVRLMSELSGLRGKEALRRSHEMMDFCGFGEERYREVESYSTGMRQKLKFAQALVHDPPLLILDEPTTGLDPDQRLAMLKRIRNLATSHGKSIILSTHILSDVRTVCDHVIILVNGQVRMADSMANLSRPIEPTMHLSILGDHQPFQNRASEAGFQSAWNQDKRTLDVFGIESTETMTIWNWAAETGTAIRAIEPAVNSLEQIFIDVAAAKKHGSNDNAIPAGSARLSEDERGNQ